MVERGYGRIVMVSGRHGGNVIQEHHGVDVYSGAT
jgi:hypothetical protein